MKRPKRPDMGWGELILSIVLVILGAGTVGFILFGNLIASAMGFGPPVE